MDSDSAEPLMVRQVRAEVTAFQSLIWHWTALLAEQVAATAGAEDPVPLVPLKIDPTPPWLRQTVAEKPQ
ncbi:hypothetical protein J2X46_002677 [Nocardioides sp. BE266]|uniref:hypothetical protein n=1 Tax=Nocardioides sp. BE266 TaxID=2817725 RepID=UPI00285B2274|nr:hypothetical protein [Nocardioides sp. BE266]MDR7253687.1 hypothetical protein [Nocardioides sp. BE266]